MSIKEKGLKIKGYALNEPFLVIGLLCVVAFASFYTGRLSASSGDVPMEHIPMRMTVSTENADKSNETLAHSSTTVEASSLKNIEQEPAATTGVYVGSKKGNKYHLPWCSGAKTMSEENKIWFGTKEEAESRGYTPAANCKGI